MALSRSKAVAELLRHARHIPDFGEIISVLGDFEQSTRNGTADKRAFILICVGILEYALAVAISSQLRNLSPKGKAKLFDGDPEREAIIGSLYSRNIVANAFDIYGDKTYSEIDSIRMIRNAVAHAIHDKDISPDILASLCDFHAITERMTMALGTVPYAGLLAPKSPMHAMATFIQMIVPYLLLHSSADWSPINRAQWRAAFS